MKDIDLNNIWNMALAETNYDVYAKKVENYFGENFDSKVEIESIELFKASHISIKDLIRYAGLTQKEFSLRYCIPLRTIEAWCADKRKCSDYLRLLLYNDISKTRFNLYRQIIRRADIQFDLNRMQINELDLYADIKKADLHFNLQLEEWLDSDWFHFANDFFGIIENINRNTFSDKTDFNGFVPKFAFSNKETNKRKLYIYNKIADRAEKELDFHGDRQFLLMDIESADLYFNLQLEEWLNADEFDFSHDLFGIVNNIQRGVLSSAHFRNHFVPIFARRNKNK